MNSIDNSIPLKEISMLGTLDLNVKKAELLSIYFNLHIPEYG